MEYFNYCVRIKNYAILYNIKIINIQKEYIRFESKTHNLIDRSKYINDYYRLPIPDSHVKVIGKQGYFCNIKYAKHVYYMKFSDITNDFQYIISRATGYTSESNDYVILIK